MPSFKVYKGSAGGIQESKTTKPDLVSDQVLIRITASGLCGTDLHYQNADMVLGHEGVGVVEGLGPEVKRPKKGDRVEWGYQTDSCGLSDQCLSGNDEYCPERQIYGQSNLDQGSLAEMAVWREAFLFKIPDNITDAEAAPLMCGGATTWNALHKYVLSPCSTVGILGIGGLGHLAIQYASQMGMNVVVFSTTESKKGEALGMGASQFVVTQGKKELETSVPKLDTFIVTSSVEIEWGLYLPLLNSGGVIIPLTVHFGNFTVPQYPLMGNGLRVQGTVISSRSEMGKMLAFSARKDVRPQVMTFPLSKEGIEGSMKTLSEGKMRYRGVLVAQ